jgi:hypothetical protein
MTRAVIAALESALAREARPLHERIAEIACALIALDATGALVLSKKG